MTTLNLNQKEKMLLHDQKSHEELCIQKYSNYALLTQDQELKQLFTNYASQEQQHLNTINQILSGQIPQMNQSQSQTQGSGQQMSQVQGNMQTQMQSTGGTLNQNDAALCSDLLMSEKYISGAYNIAIFECTNSAVRQVLNHIQKEEQQHGEGIFNYMQSHGMYNSQ
ncbi:MAG: spore coat protein [Halanaerobiales bacterium]|nr:spore coat protein [Halanaerobiales bacterium]